jgi:Zn-dependent M16 (insulinase) family peptidase
VVYFNARLNTSQVLTKDELEILPLFSMVMTSMGAHDKSYRDMDTLMELYTGGLGASMHLSESPGNASQMNQEGLLLSSLCLEKNSDKMFSLWNDFFQGIKFSAKPCRPRV